jgi:hypothetical protein
LIRELFLKRYDLIVTSSQDKAALNRERETSVKKQALTRICAITLIALINAMLISTLVQPYNAQANADSSFSIIWITDTQYLSESHPTYYDNLCHWIVENKDTYNVKMVVHTGDIVNQEGNHTQWINANQSMSILLDNQVPYCWDTGNHDYNSTCWIGNQYYAFNPQVMQAKPYWVSNEFDGMNTAVRFNVADWDCLIVNIAFDANDSVLAWASNILDSNPQSHVIMATHAYIDKQCNYDLWANNFKNTVLETNPNVFLTLSGHYHPTSGNRTRVGERDELLFNQQDAETQLGAASARILTFDTAKGTVNVQTYVFYLNQFLQDPNNNFTLNTTFRNDVTGEGFSEFPVIAVLIVIVSLGILGLIYFKRKPQDKPKLETDWR